MSEARVFIIEDTKQANQIAEGIQGLAGFNKKDQVLVIHTKNNGELTTNQKDLEALREQARMIDDTKSPVKVVVSVLMLREGWDVKNVSIILGLRPFTSKANILPEQSIGRGLRLMRDLAPTTPDFRNHWYRQVRRVCKAVRNRRCRRWCNTKTASIRSMD